MVELRRTQRRRDARVVLAEGPHVVAEGLDAGWPLLTCLYTAAWAAGTDGAALLQRISASMVSRSDCDWDACGILAVVDEAVLQRATSTKTPQGIVGVFGPRPRRSAPPAVYPRLYLALDRLQDPGNVGALIRSAVAFGGEGTAVLCARDGADPYGAKAVRASAGAVFWADVVEVASLEASVGLWKAKGVRWWALVPHGGAPVGRCVPATGPIGILIGQEGSGLSRALMALGEPVSISMCGPVESLNAAVAGAIALFSVAQCIATT